MSCLRLFRLALIFSLFFVSLTPAIQARAQATPTISVDVVFVARAHLATEDDVFEDDLGPAGQFGTGLPKFAPGSKLLLRQSSGNLVTLVDGANPTAATGNLVDVQSPDVSFDGTKIVFAGATTIDPASAQYGWRLYEIGVNGTGFRQLPIPGRSPTFTIPNNNPNSYNFGNSQTYGWWNDLFPAYLADGRIAFMSSRYPTRAHYDGRHTYNLYIVNSDGTGLRRVTTERGGLLHPTPLPDGRILLTRWWNNFNQPSTRGIYNRIDNRDEGYFLSDDTYLNANPDAPFNAAEGHLPSRYDIRSAPNTWHLMAINPDGTNFHRFAFTPYAEWALTDDSGLDTYVGAQPAVIISGTQWYIAFTSQQDTTMVHSTFKTGIRIAYPGITHMYSNTADAVAGLTYAKAWGQDDDSPPYALHPWGLPDGNILFSQALTYQVGLPSTGVYTDRITNKAFALQGSNLQYQLYTMNLKGQNQTLVATSIGTADAMDAKPVIARVGWTALPDGFTATPNDDPRLGNVPNTLPEYPFSLRSLNQILTATLHNPNIYANAPLTLPFINNSPMPGSIAWAQVYIDANQFTGAYCYGNYPNPCATFKPDNELRAVLWTQVPVDAKGAFTAVVPADTPGFVVLRDAAGRAVSGWNRGYISIAQGSAWARPGETVTCVGCHFGHVSGSIDSVKTEAEQGWTNVAPYATVRVSSYYTDGAEYETFFPWRLVDRRGWVPTPPGGPGGVYQDDTTGWISALERDMGEWAELTWPIAMTITKVRLIGSPSVGGDWGGFGQHSTITPYYITNGTLRFYLDGAQVGGDVNVGQVQPLANGGTLLTLAAPLRVDKLTFTVNATTGYWWWDRVAALNEIEVTGQAAETYTAPWWRFVPGVRK